MRKIINKIKEFFKKAKKKILWIVTGISTTLTLILAAIMIFAKEKKDDLKKRTKDAKKNNDELISDIDNYERDRVRFKRRKKIK